MVGHLKQLAQVLVLLATMPASTHYTLNNYTFGSGGTAGSTSTHYDAEATAGEQSSQTGTSTHYAGTSGNNQTQQSNVPPAPTFTNPSNYYNRLHFVINTGSNPSDTLFAIAISSNNFTTTQYVQNDDTVSPTFNTSLDYQNYTAWGGASGQNIIGLTASTTYEIEVKAMQGNYTETQYGPDATAATVAPYLNFEIDISATDMSTSPPYLLSLGNLLPATITSSSLYIWNTLDTNANNGGNVYVSSANSGLHSPTAGYTIPSASVNLSGATVDEGGQNLSLSQTSGGPLTVNSPYNGSGQNVGIFDTTIRPLYSSTAPITHGRGSMVLKAIVSAQTPAANDYSDTLTMIAAASF